jgi:broad specificity phosphatase PhoE
MQYHCRHGEHVNNKLTPKGVEEVTRAAQWVVKDLKRRSIRFVSLVTSEEGRAIETANLFRRELDQARIGVVSFPGRFDLNPAKGIAAIMGKEGVPKYGDGLIEAWLAMGKAVPPGCETFEGVGARCTAAIRDFPGNNVVAVYHGGCIEPTVCALTGRMIRDLPSAAVVPIETTNCPVFDPNEEPPAVAGPLEVP